MALKGNLRDFSVVQLFNLINLARKTGTLRIEHADARAKLSFKVGKLVYATLDETGRELIVALRQSGLLTEEQARTMRERAGRRSDKELGLLLINAGYVSQDDILRSMQARVMDNVYPLFTWTEGTFRFDSGGPQLDGAITVRIDLENVIMQGTRRLEEWERLQEELPDLGISLKFADRPRANLRDISLNVQEWRVISFINPRNTIRQIAQYNILSDFQIRKIVYGLLQAGLVEIVRPVPEEPERPKEPRRPEAPKPTSPQDRRPDVKRNVIMRLIDRIREL
ncbi:MAG: DUF4388 domain-containing protein [Anaerolineae bacterium]|jgi:hypothetical protein